MDVQISRVQTPGTVCVSPVYRAISAMHRVRVWVVSDRIAFALQQQGVRSVSCALAKVVTVDLTSDCFLVSVTFAAVGKQHGIDPPSGRGCG